VVDATHIEAKPIPLRRVREGVLSGLTSAQT
jgi:hypothetical protein